MHAIAIASPPIIATPPTEIVLLLVLVLGDCLPLSHVPGLSEPGYNHSDVVAEVGDLGCPDPPLQRVHRAQARSYLNHNSTVIFAFQPTFVARRPLRLAAFALKPAG